MHPFTNVYGLARTSIATGALLTLLTNTDGVLFMPTGRMGRVASALATDKWTLFLLLQEHLWLARLIAVLGLAIVVSGYRPRFTAILHWWITFSLMQAMAMPDGGDQAASVLTLLMVPIALCDPRKWHWSAPPEIAPGGRTFLANSTLFVCRLQVCAIYFHAAVGKMPVNEWADGTALYYWLLDPTLGLPSSYYAWITPVLMQPYALVAGTWSVIILELILVLALSMPARRRRLLLIPAVLFHFFNVLFFGLTSFFFSMCGALILYLPDAAESLSLAPVHSPLERVRRWFGKLISWQQTAKVGQIGE